MTRPGGRPPGTSVRLRLTLSYAGFLMLAGALLMAVVWVFLLRYVPERTFAGDGMPMFPSQGDLVEAFAPKAALALVALLGLGLVGGWVLAGTMLAPLARITAATRRVAAGSLSTRIELEGRRDEFRELADAFDAMVARLEAQVAEQQRFAANASHELRTPLAVTRTIIDVAQRDPRHDDREMLERLRVVNARAIDLTEAMLLLSRADQRAFAREPVDLSLVAEEAAETLLPLAEKHGVALATTGSAAWSTGSPALLLQVAINLLHNAVVHNHAESGSATVTTGSDHGSAVLVVENSGDRLSPALVATLAEPFQRGSERARTDHAGVGLGLAIVGSIVRAHDGTLTLRPRRQGGLVATVRLPSAT